MDDHTRMTWIYLLHSKSDVLHILPAFYTYVKVQYGILIKGVCFDNALELTFTQFFFCDNGIQAYHSYVETPQQSLIVERKHQHLLSFACALLFQFGLPLG